MMYFLVSAILKIIDLFLVFYFFKSYSDSTSIEKQKKISIFDNKLIFLLLLIPNLGISLQHLHLIPTNMTSLLNFFAKFVSVFLVGLFFNFTFLTSLFLTATFVAINLVSEGLTLFIGLPPLFDSLDASDSALLTNYIMSVILKVVIVLWVSILFSFLKKHAFSVFYVLLSIPIISTICFCIFLVTNQQLKTNFNLKTALFILAGICINIFVLMVYRKIKKEADEKKAYEEIINEINIQNKYYEEVEKSQYQIRLAKHDMNNKLTTIAGYLKNEDLSTALHYIEKDIDFIGTKSSEIYALNPVLNYLLTSKLNEAEENQIEFKVECFIPESLEISNSVIAIILGNLLDNAIHACQNMTEDAKKEILTKIKYYDDSLFIEVINNYDLNQPHNPKHQGEGLGIKSVKKVVQDCDGIYRQWVENNLYYVNIILWNFKEDIHE